MNKKELIAENNQLRQICIDLAWMARRYADGRMSAAVAIYNDNVEKLVKMGVKVKPDTISENTIWAKDGSGRQFDQLHDDHMTNTPVGRGEAFWPRGTRLCDEISEMLGTTSPSVAAAEIKRLKDLERGITPTKIENIIIAKKRGRKPKNVKLD
jgi:hypothetical protein